MRKLVLGAIAALLLTLPQGPSPAAANHYWDGCEWEDTGVVKVGAWRNQYGMGDVTIFWKTEYFGQHYNHNDYFQMSPWADGMLLEFRMDMWMDETLIHVEVVTGAHHYAEFGCIQDGRDWYRVYGPQDDGGAGGGGGGGYGGSW